MQLCVQCNTALLCLYKAWLLFHHIPVILIPSSVSLSKTVIQSLPRSLSLSICQSAVSHSLIQSVPRLLSLSVSCSFSHSIPLSLFAHLTSPSLTHQHFPPIHHSTRLSCQVLHYESLVSLPLYQANFLVSESHLPFLFCGTLHELHLLQTSSVFCTPWPITIHLLPATRRHYFFALCHHQLLLSLFLYLSR